MAIAVAHMITRPKAAPSSARPTRKRVGFCVQIPEGRLRRANTKTTSTMDSTSSRVNAKSGAPCRAKIPAMPHPQRLTISTAIKRFGAHTAPRPPLMMISASTICIGCSATMTSPGQTCPLKAMTPAGAAVATSRMMKRYQPREPRWVLEVSQTATSSSVLIVARYMRSASRAAGTARASVVTRPPSQNRPKPSAQVSTESPSTGVKPCHSAR